MELKFRNTEVTDDAFTTTWTAMDPTGNCLTAIEQGSSEKQRSGRKAWLTSLQIRGEIHVPQSEGATNPHEHQHFRLILVLDRQTNGAALTATTVMEPVGANNLFSFPQLESTGRYKILWDRTFTINPWQMNEGAINLYARNGTKVLFKLFRSFNPPIPIQHTTSADPPTVGEVVDNSIHLMGLGTTTSGLLSYHCRIRFRG